MFGHFLMHNKELEYSDLRHKASGTPIVAVRSNRMYQFGIYGNGYVFFQQCRNLLTYFQFSITKCSVRDFCNGDPIYEYTPDFEFDKTYTYQNAKYCAEAFQGKRIDTVSQIPSIYGDDFVLLCMVGYETFTNAFHQSKMGLHYKYSFYIGGIAPAQHHFLGIEEGWVIHFSLGGDKYRSQQIILEQYETVESRAENIGNNVLRVIHKDEGLYNRLTARNRALLAFAGYVSFGKYDLMTNNCEHFVNWCKTGKLRSTQVTNFIIDATAVLASFAFRTPNPLLVRLAQRGFLPDLE